MGDHKPSISHLESAKNKVNSLLLRRIVMMTSYEIKLEFTRRLNQKWNGIHQNQFGTCQWLGSLPKRRRGICVNSCTHFSKKKIPTSHFSFIAPTLDFFWIEKLTLKKDKRLTPKCTMYYTMCAVKLFFPWHERRRTILSLDFGIHFNKMRFSYQTEHHDFYFE